MYQHLSIFCTTFQIKYFIRITPCRDMPLNTKCFLLSVIMTDWVTLYANCHHYRSLRCSKNVHTNTRLYNARIYVDVDRLTHFYLFYLFFWCWRFRQSELFVCSLLACQFIVIPIFCISNNCIRLLLLRSECSLQHIQPFWSVYRSSFSNSTCQTVCSNFSHFCYFVCLPPPPICAIPKCLFMFLLVVVDFWQQNDWLTVERSDDVCQHFLFAVSIYSSLFCSSSIFISQICIQSYPKDFMLFKIFFGMVSG